jgi:8-oxo-dGTP pyrophosphatase MutT (NUDIX family)
MSAVDTRWDTAHERFNYRVAGVCVERGHAFLGQLAGTDTWFMPGGLCPLMEPAATTLAREMWEELGVGVRVGRLLWIHEHFFDLDGRRWHEVGLYFRMALPADSACRDQARTFIRPAPESASHHVFRRFPLAQLERVRLFPAFLRTALHRLPRTPRHVVAIQQGEAGPRERAPWPRDGEPVGERA